MISLDDKKTIVIFYSDLTHPKVKLHKRILCHIKKFINGTNRCKCSKGKSNGKIS